MSGSLEDVRMKTLKHQEQSHLCEESSENALHFLSVIELVVESIDTFFDLKLGRDRIEIGCPCQ